MTTSKETSKEVLNLGIGEKPNREGFTRDLLLKAGEEGLSLQSILDSLEKAGFLIQSKDKNGNKIVEMQNHKTSLSSLFGLLKTNQKKKSRLLERFSKDGELYFRLIDIV